MSSAPTLAALLLSAGGIAFVHTFAPDHWMPFAALARAQKWPKRKLLGITLVAGLAHVGSSFVIGLLGLWLGWALHAIQWLQSQRGQGSLYILIVFGLVYAGLGWWRARRWKDAHPHEDGTVHAHPHGTMKHAHTSDRMIRAAAPRAPFELKAATFAAATPDAVEHRKTHSHRHGGLFGHRHLDLATVPLSAWSLFVVFVLGPCEALVPLMFAGAQLGKTGVVAVTLSFSGVTTLTMTALAFAAFQGFKLIPSGTWERHIHTWTGAAISATAALVLILGI